jgi:DNA-binding NarL/FixJ family response regulator
MGGFYMIKSSKKILTAKHKHRIFQEYNELIDMIESGMEDYEIASELGIDSGIVSEVKNQIYNDEFKRKL